MTYSPSEMASDKDAAQAILSQLPINPGDRFEHYKVGGTYEIVTLALKEDTLEPLVVYRSVERESTWVRTYENFTEEIELNGSPIKRFALLDKVGAEK